MKDYLTIHELSAQQKLTASQIRNWIWRDTNGFRKCTKKIARRIYISEADFKKWMKKQ